MCSKGHVVTCSKGVALHKDTHYRHLVSNLPSLKNPPRQRGNGPEGCANVTPGRMSSRKTWRRRRRFPRVLSGRRKLSWILSRIAFALSAPAPEGAPESAPKAASNHWTNERIFAGIWFAGAAGNALLGINFMMTVAEISQPRR